MFFGYYEHSLDNKGRLVIPNKFRLELSSKVYITKGFDGAIDILKESTFNRLLEELEYLPFTKKSNRDYIRARLAASEEVEVDKMGRIQIPAVLLRKYQIGKDVVIIGVNDHVELWDKEAYLKYQEGIDEEFEENAERLLSDE